MASIAEQLAGLSVLDTLKHASVPGTMSNLPWQGAVGSWSEVAGWSPAAFTENPPTNTRSGLYINAGKVSGNYGLGLKKTTGSLATASRQFEVWLFYQGGASASGYQLRVIAEASGKVQYKLTKWVEGVGTVLIESAKELTFAESDSFFLSRVGNNLGIYHRTGEGTPELVGSEVEDTTFTEGYVGFGGNGSNPRLINLQGGALTALGETVRQFSSSPTSEIVTSNGSITGGELTLVAIVKYEEDGNIAKTVNASNEDIEPNPQLAINLGVLISHGALTSPSLKPPKGSWCLVAYTKYPGTNKPRQHMYDFTTKTWTHAEASITRSEGTPAEWGKWRIGGKTSAVGPFKGAIAAVARFTKVLSDAQVERLVNAEAIGAWTAMTPAPVMLWEFGQTAVSQELKDLVGTANQTSRVETTVLEEAPPMKYGTLGERIGKYVKVWVGGALQEVKRWIMVGGSLVSK